LASKFVAIRHGDYVALPRYLSLAQNTRYTGVLVSKFFVYNKTIALGGSPTGVLASKFFCDPPQGF